MKICSAILALVLAAGLFGCGGSETATSATASKDIPEFPLPQVPPQKQPLKKLVIKNLKEGEGPKAEWGDTLTVRYNGVYYKTGKFRTLHWGFSWTFKLDGEMLGPGWQQGFHGMRPGGRRELLIPARSIYIGKDVAYVVEVLKIKPGPKQSS